MMGIVTIFSFKFVRASRVCPGAVIVVSSGILSPCLDLVSVKTRICLAVFHSGEIANYRFAELKYTFANCSLDLAQLYYVLKPPCNENVLSRQDGSDDTIRSL